MSPDGARDRAPPRVFVRERRGSGPGHEVFVNDRWEERFPGLSAGITARSEDADFGLATAASPWVLSERMEALCRQLGFEAAVLARQVHGREVIHLREPPRSGLLLAGSADGLITGREGVLLTATAADCVPVYIVDPVSRSLGLLHAGWRGAAAGVLQAGVEALDRDLGAAAGDLHLHLGPAICGECYEVGPEVLEAFGRGGARGREGMAGSAAAARTGEASGEPRAGGGRLDLRDELAARAALSGIAPDRISHSPWCTRCDGDHFHSHRGRGDEAGRMAAFLGWTRPTRGDGTT